MHLDLAETSEAGISLFHKELGDDMRTIYVTDFIAWITSPTRIDLNAITQLIIDLRSVYDINIHTLSADQFQSSAIRQELELRKAAQNVEYQSTIKTSLQYLSLASIVASNSFKVGKAPKFKKQLEGIHIDDKGKIYSSERSDMSDVAAGGVENARKNIKDVPQFVYSHYRRNKTKPEVHFEGYKKIV
jgi:hypothetical protein